MVIGNLVLAKGWGRIWLNGPVKILKQNSNYFLNSFMLCLCFHKANSMKLWLFLLTKLKNGSKNRREVFSQIYLQDLRLTQSNNWIEEQPTSLESTTFLLNSEKKTEGKNQFMNIFLSIDSQSTVLRINCLW